VSDDFVIIDSDVILESFVFDVERRTIAHQGEEFQRDVVVHPGAVAILAIDADGRVAIISQYRATVDRFTFEVPAGTCDISGEEPLETAKRELLEEVGVEAEHWQQLGSFMNSPGWTSQTMHIFEAKGLTTVGRTPHGPEEESSHILWLHPSELRELLLDQPSIDSTLAVALHRIYGGFFG
jgi:ADP-ribose pyrophosphatase